MNSRTVQRCLIPATVLLASAASVLGETPLAQPGPVTAGSIILSSVRMIGALALVFALFAGALWLFKNWQRFAGRTGPTAKLNVLEVKSLGHRQAIYVVGYEQQRLLLAASPTGITMLTSLPSADHEAAETGVIPQPNFTDLFVRALKGKS
ncbi:MAG: flagellar biosynthetic protein FliO [Verrucomicrobiales bacterium]|nr:flagellar biosynthetic protein FliO [Verrucomicrobiales bacterium]